jgi:aldose 1-epimerase
VTADASPRELPGTWELRAGQYTAAVDAVGGTLRALRFAGRDLVVPFPAGAVRPLYRGTLCAPWPNRVVDGRYSFDGSAHQLALTEPERGHALHGLVGWLRWDAAEAAADRIVLRCAVVPQEGYPFALDLAVEYALSGEGLFATLTASNCGAAPAPYGCCPHPYLVAGPGRVDDWLLTLPVASRLEVDERLVPERLVPVADVDCLFEHRPVGRAAIDHAFTGLERGPDGLARVSLVTDRGTGVEISWGSWAPWVQVHTADRPEPELNRVGLAVEPMSCPPDAFNSGTDLVVLAPGGRHEATWAIRALLAQDVA